MFTSRPSIGLFVALLAFGAPAAAAPTPGQKCASSKTKEAGKKINCKAKCDSKAVKSGVAPDTACLTKCHDKFSLKWARLELKGGCATVGDEAAIEAKVDAHLADLEASLQLGGPSKCTAAKYKESGKKGFCRLKCHSKAQKKGLTVDPLCLQKCSDKFDLKCIAAESYADCIAAVACATLEAKVDAFVDDAVAELPTETTTSTTSSTTTTTLIAFQACPADPSRTIYAGDSGTAACRQFDDVPTLCEQAFHQTQSPGSFASCFYDGSTCRGCGPENRDQGRCINTCVEGPTPVCAGDPSRTVFAGFSGTSACQQYGTQVACEQAFHMSGVGVETSCYWDGGASECRGCGPNNQDQGFCVNTCPVCVGDPSRTTFAGGPNTGACRLFDGDQAGCEQAFHAGGAHSVGMGSCWYDAGSDECRGCAAHGDPSDCRNECAVCEDDPTRVHLPGHGACHFYDGSQSFCDGAFHTALDGSGKQASCWYDVGTNECSGCGPQNQQSGLCINTCEGPICGDNQVNQAGEECDGTDDAACSGIGLGCRGDCNCERCENGTVDAGEACDTPGLQGSCPAGTTCNDNCTACLTECGDGVVGGSEACDYGAPGSCPVGESCNFSCTVCQAVCGDGQVGGSEVCDVALPGSCPVGESCDGTCSACLGCPTPTLVDSAGGVFVGSTVGGTSISGDCGASSLSPERYFEWTPDVSHVATISLCGGTTNYDTVVYIRQGAVCSGPSLACNDDSFCGLPSTINPFVVAGTTYTIVVDGFAGNQGNFTLTVSPSGAFLDSPLE